MFQSQYSHLMIMQISWKAEPKLEAASQLWILAVAFWPVTPYCLVSRHRRFGGKCVCLQRRITSKNYWQMCFNPLTPNDPYRGRTAPLTSKRGILYIYSTNIGTEFLNMVYNLLFFSSKRSLFHNSNVFGSCIIHILYTGCDKIKKKYIPVPKC
jgi:hypothetical protein